MAKCKLKILQEMLQGFQRVFDHIEDVRRYGVQQLPALENKKS